MSDTEAASVLAKRDRHLYTIGHSTLPPRRFVALLLLAGVEVLVDVRSAPDRGFAQYRPPSLTRLVRAAGLRYLYLGDQLGGRPTDRTHLHLDGSPNYAAMAESPEFRAGLDRLRRGLERYRLALLCAEEDPRRCHRHGLIGAALRQESVLVLHIRASGHVQTDADLTLGRPGRVLSPPC